jgi:trimethylamine:corrinoid methyltransferase-like protein
MGRQACRGIATGDDDWHDDLLGGIQPGDHFIDRRSTVRSIRSGAWHIPSLGMHDTFEGWVAAGKPALLEGAREKAKLLLDTHQPLPLDKEVERELDRLQQRARAES